MGTPPGGSMGATSSPQGLHAPAATRPVTSISGMTLGTTSPSMESGPSGAVPGMTMPPGTGMSGSMSGGPLGGSEPVKRKRGRPRKYTGTDAEGNIIPLATPLSGSSPLVAGSPSTPSERRSRGRPPGSGKKQQLAALGMYLALVNCNVAVPSVLIGSVSCMNKVM
jgi:hypothetical protein